MKKILCSLLMYLLVAVAIVHADNPLLLLGELPPVGPVKSLSSVTAVQSEEQVVVSFAFDIGVVDIAVVDAEENVVYHEVVNTGITPGVVIDTTLWPSGDYVLVITWDKNKQITGKFNL